MGGDLSRLLAGLDFSRLDEADAEAPPALRCEVCGDLGWVYDRTLPTEHPEYGQKRPCKCQPSWTERIDRHWRKWSGVPERLRPLRLEQHPNLTSSNPGLLEALLRADVRQESWFFWGTFGVGKSGIAAGYAWRYLNETGESVLWRTLPDLLEAIRETYNSGGESESGGTTEAELIRTYTSAGLLVLDDVGAERLRETGPDSWAADVLYRIIGRRHSEVRPTVFTSNLDLDAVKTRLGERITWRIVEMTNRGAGIVEVLGNNLRA